MKYTYHLPEVQLRSPGIEKELISQFESHVFPEGRGYTIHVHFCALRYAELGLADMSHLRKTLHELYGIHPEVPIHFWIGGRQVARHPW